MHLRRLLPVAPFAVAALLFAQPALAQRSAESSRTIARSLLAPSVGMLLGVLSGAVGGGIGALAGGCFTLGSNPDPIAALTTCAGAVLGGVMAGFLLGTPAGVTWIGDLLGGRGTFGGAFAGVIVGMVATAFIAFTLTPTLIPPKAEALPTIIAAAAILPPGGAVLGYEIVSSMRDMITPPPGFTLAPVLREGRLAGGILGVRFASF